ncbi:MAG: MutS-related protein [Gemmatimonadota bacterium]
MIIDEQTFRDLEIFKGREGRPSLFQLLDRCKTHGGEASLRRRFLQPKSDATSIRAVQDSVRYIIDNPELFDGIPSQYSVSGFENYFYRSLTAPVTGQRLGLLFDMIMLRVDSPRDYTRIATGITHCTQIVGWFRKLARHADGDAPGELGAMLSEIRELLARPDIGIVPVAELDGHSFWKVLRVDQGIRGIERSAFARMLALLFEIDALTSLAKETVRRGFILPEILEGPARVIGTGLFHPFLDSPVGNPVRLDQQQRVLFLTGPNMAGKTTYLRTCGIAVFLGHVGMGVPAAGLSFTPCDAFFTAISLSDDVRAGISFFQAEAMRARAIADALARDFRVIAIMDEPFKGTNVKDALDASCAFFSRLAHRDGSLFLIASHLIEAGPILDATAQVNCQRFEAVENGTGLHFDYQLRPGLSSQRLGMRVLEDHGVLRLLDEKRGDHISVIAPVAPNGEN